MTNSMAEILSRVESLSLHERAELAYALVCSLGPDDEQGISEAWDAELTRRVEEIRSGAARGKPAEQVFAELRQRQS